ncbi:type II toxin-antitoxin system VapC family toxin [Paucibacter sp. R3-3]|uniref:Ribonuclease VapC n=1 Tax=Roseateles agri TaxID=3098619 RepID=A0ABU5DBA1_9BURK|nr:type II toxin-antitoxin system VapC family toxin [Paucibacter sp. R3-3]MDY0743555.1 type II toxin-antitoxin system VapC family toxin [Paucibacter sp. R3-3]
MIYLDSCLLIYAIEQDPVFGPPAVTAIASVPPLQLCVSPLVRMECLVKPMRDGHVLLQRRFETALGELKLLEMTEPVFQQATELRARFGLKTPDALHLACAMHHGCSALWTNDDRLAKAAHGLALNVLATIKR